MEEVLGWGASSLLIATIAAQLHKQWKSASVEGVSIWLYLGQFSASAGLGVYSFLGEQWVFVVLNIVMALAALAGAVMWHQLRHGRVHRSSRPSSSPS